MVFCSPYLSDLVSPLFFVNLPTKILFPSGVTPWRVSPGAVRLPSDATECTPPGGARVNFRTLFAMSGRLGAWIGSLERVLEATTKKGRQLFEEKKVHPPDKILATPMVISFWPVINRFLVLHGQTHWHACPVPIWLILCWWDVKPYSINQSTRVQTMTCWYRNIS